MFCEKCGRQNDDDAKFCESCGGTLAPIENQMMSSQTAGEIAQKRKANKLLIILLCFIVIAGAVVGVLFGTKAARKNKLQQKLEVAREYLDEMNYDMAIATYKEILEIDPKNTDAYIGLSDVYIATGDIDEAVSVLITGYNETEDEEVYGVLGEAVSLVVEEKVVSEGEMIAAEYIGEVQEEIHRPILEERKEELEAIAQEKQQAETTGETTGTGTETGGAETTVGNEGVLTEEMVAEALEGVVGRFIKCHGGRNSPESFLDAMTNDYEKRTILCHELPIGWIPEEMVKDVEGDIYVTEENLKELSYFAYGDRDLSRFADFYMYDPFGTMPKDGNIYYFAGAYRMGDGAGGMAFLDYTLEMESDTICNVTYTVEYYVEKENEWWETVKSPDYPDQFLITFRIIADPDCSLCGMRIIQAKMFY